MELLSKTVILRQHEMEKLTMTAKPEIQPWMRFAASAFLHAGTEDAVPDRYVIELAEFIATHEPEQEPSISVIRILQLQQQALDGTRNPAEEFWSLIDEEIRIAEAQMEEGYEQTI